jgi:hypothetical protein
VHEYRRTAHGFIGLAVFLLLTQMVWAIPRYAPREVLVRISSTAMKPTVTSVFTRLGLESAQRVFPRVVAARIASGTEWWHYRITGGLDPLTVADSLNSLPNVTAQPNYRYRYLDAPSDPEWDNQWGAKRIGVDKVWRTVIAQASDTSIITIIDSGVNYLHPDLTSRIWINRAEADGVPGVDDDGNGYIDDVRGWDFTDVHDVSARGDYKDRDNDPNDEEGHGTNVAGVVAAVFDNGIGIAGTSPVSQIMCLRAGAVLTTGQGFLEDDDIASAIVYATDNGSDVINMSFGDISSTPLMHDAIKYAAYRGVVLVASAGNESTPTLLYPAAYKETIAVGATAEGDQLASFSSWGENLDLVAPGVSIRTTHFGDGYRYNGGTSFSAPFVAGACGILLGIAPDLTPDQVRALIISGTEDLGEPGWDEHFGHGILSLPKVIAGTSGPLANISSPLRPSGSHISIGWSGQAGGAPPVAWSLTYGEGTAPTTWVPDTNGVTTDPYDRISGTLTTSGLRDGTYAIRLMVHDAFGRTAEDRTIIAVDHTSPVFTSLPEIRKRWKDTHEEIIVQWVTDDRTTGVIEIWQGTTISGDPITSIPAAYETTDHIWDITSSVTSPGAWTVQVTTRNAAGLATISVPLSFTADLLSVPQDGFTRISTLPQGVIMETVTDFNGNGVPEIALKPATRATYDTTSFYEILPGGTPALRFECPVPMRPVISGDLDGNGLKELIGIDFTGSQFHVKVVEQATVTSAPTETWWDTPGVLAPLVADIDGDGKTELLVLDDADRTAIRVYESVGTHQLILTATLRVPETADGQFDIWKTVADTDGDGRLEVIAGTTEGDVVIFTSTGDNAYAVSRVIQGIGNATRVWGGLDLNGDAKADFAVLRYIQQIDFDLSGRYFRLDIYGTDDTPFFSREFADPGRDGNGFASGPIGPGGTNALVIATPARLYVATPSLDRLTWFSKTVNPCQPLVADVDGVPGAELVFAAQDGIVVVSSTPAGSRPTPPANLAARPLNRTSAEVAWDMTPGKTYRVWSGPNASSLTPTTGTQTSPTVVSPLTDGVPVSFAVQTIDRSITDSLGTLGTAVTATPQAGPRLVSIRDVHGHEFYLTFDQPLDPTYVGIESLWFDVEGKLTSPRTVILDRGNQRMVAKFPHTIAGDIRAYIVYSVRALSGAETSTKTKDFHHLPTLRAPTGFSYAIPSDKRTIYLGLQSPIESYNMNPSTVSLVSGPAIERIDDLCAPHMYPEMPCSHFMIHLASDMSPNSTYLIQTTDLDWYLPYEDRRFKAAAIINTGILDQPPQLSAIIQESSTRLMLVSNREMRVDEIRTSDLNFVPALTVTSVDTGENRHVLFVNLDPNTPVGPWQPSYSVGLFAPLVDGGQQVLLGTLGTLANQPVTQRVISADVIDRTTVRLVFGDTLATIQPEGVVSIEPNIDVTGVSVIDSVMDVHLSTATPLGSWGITYYLRADSVLTKDGRPLWEFVPLTIPPMTSIDSTKVFPQPFRPSKHGHLVFGGLPREAQLRIYSITGALIRKAEDIDTGGFLWDGRNLGGKLVASGVYLYVIDSNKGRKTGKFVVVR